MLIDVVMPQLGESVVEGVVVKWLVEVGELVAKDQPLLEISTDKVDAEIPSPSAGRVAQILVKPGETVPIQAVLAKTRDGPGGVPARARSGAEMGRGDRGVPRPHGAEERNRRSPRPRASSRPPPRLRRPRRPDGSGSLPWWPDGRRTWPGPVEDPGHRHRRTGDAEGRGGVPRLRSLAKEARLRRLRSAGEEAQGCGGQGVRPRGLRSYRQPALAEGDQVVPWTPIRKKIAEHMVRSKQTSPHVHIFAEVDMHRVAAVRAKAKKEGVNLTYLPFVIHAAAKALRETPIMNAIVSGESTVLKKDIHIAVAVDTEKGLLVPVLRHADRMSLKEISAAMDDFGARAKSGKISPDELSGGTFSITNPGIKGNLFGTPIINQPQVGILRLGQIVKRPVVIDADGEDSIVIRPMMYLCCAYDHRVIDGVAGNGFLYRVREILEAGDFS